MESLIQRVIILLTNVDTQKEKQMSKRSKRSKFTLLNQYKPPIYPCAPFDENQDSGPVHFIDKRLFGAAVNLKENLLVLTIFIRTSFKLDF